MKTIFLGGYTVFVGSSIQCISWATGASSLGDVGVGRGVGVEGGVGVQGGDGEQHFLAVSCHNDSDSPRLDSSQTFSHANMLQIWDFGNLTTLVSLSLYSLSRNLIYYF